MAENCEHEKGDTDEKGEMGNIGLVEKENEGDWILLARVLDRIFFMVFLVCCVVTCTAILLYHSV